MNAYVLLGGLLVLGSSLGMGLAFGLHYWSRDATILRARRRELRARRRAGARQEARRRLDRERAARRGSPVDTGLGKGRPPDMPTTGTSGGSGQA
jgi:hypothetical protein